MIRGTIIANWNVEYERSADLSDVLRTNSRKTSGRDVYFRALSLDFRFIQEGVI